MNRHASRALSRINKYFKTALDQPVISLYHYNGCGFFDGGCLLLADAMVEWSGGDIKLAAIARTRFAGEVDHWIGELELAGERFFLDANGIQTAEQLLSFWEAEELREPVMLMASPQFDEAREIPRDIAFSKRLATELLEALGSYSKWKSRVLAEIAPDESPSLG